MSGLPRDLWANPQPCRIPGWRRSPSTRWGIVIHAGFFLTPILAIILTLIGGGLIFYFEKSVPEVGKLIKHANGLIFKIMESDMRRIKKIKVTGSPKV